MTLQQIAQLIGDTWRLNRDKDHRTAANNFREVIKELEAIDPAEDTSRHLVDAYYGLGLAERGNGNKDASITAFQKALAVGRETLGELDSSMASQGKAHLNNLQSEEDDRFMMLTNMIKQRLVELGVSA